MKQKLVTPLLLLIVFSVLCSCRGGIEITKRRYRHGWYIDLGLGRKKKHSMIQENSQQDLFVVIRDHFSNQNNSF